jgi:hypothetical protein
MSMPTAAMASRPAHVLHPNRLSRIIVEEK